MGFRPDVVVMEPDFPRVALVATVQASALGMETTEGQLKAYMLARRCPVGMIVTPERIWIYHDTFTDDSPASIERVGDHPTQELLQLRAAPGDERALASAVRAWLERVSSNWMEALPRTAEVRSSLLAHIVPAVVDGRLDTEVLAR
jgi:hypothetical protein